VFVTAQQRGEKTCIAVRDTGMRLPADRLTMMFDDGPRSDGETRSDGLSLGLFIVRHAAGLLGHSVEISAAAGRGSCFTIVADAA
jgi:signal transduction histidine kinase